jgi:gas vesicle protein
MSDNNDGFKFFMGFIFGAAVGAAAGLLFAPQSGKETRKKLMEMSNGIADDIRDEYEKISEKAKSYAGEVKGSFRKRESSES